ncbi:MAG TPA: DoxX family protein [Pseudonocardiaceae bacterium]|jgi:putative oxidoreductase|nr:DoxX family protein [Pseudonocardiaceae bacterium]
MSNTSSTTGTTDYRSTSTRAQNADSVGGLGEAALSAVRIVVSFLFVCHGAQKLFGVFGGVHGQGATAPVGSWPSWWAGLIELLGGGLVLLGLFTMPAALLCSGAMAFAYFTVHQPLGLLPLQNKGEPAALYSWMFLLIAMLGPGPFALDAVLRRLRPKQRLSGNPPFRSMWERFLT